MRCPLCQRDWPPRFIQTLFTSCGNIAVDPLCALQEMRVLHGDPTLEFNAEENQQLYHDALAYLKKPPRARGKG